MKILFLFLHSDHFDYIADYLLFGLRKLGHTVVDAPRRKAHYESLPNVNKLHQQILVGPDPIDRSKHYDLDEFDAIIAENASLFMANENKDILRQLIKLEIPRVALLGNDTLNRGPLPNVRLDYRCKMAIREKCLQATTIALPYVDDFPLHFTIPREYCIHTPPQHKMGSVFFSMGLNTPMRREYANNFTNRQYDDLNQYFSAIRQHRFGISIWGGGILCQRDSELAGNTLLCRAKFQRYTREYDPFDYIDGVDMLEFSDLEELKQKVAYYDANHQAYKQLLGACYEKTIKYFTAEAQAERLLSWAMGKNQEGHHFMS
jgi:hypothetical protein